MSVRPPEIDDTAIFDIFASQTLLRTVEIAVRIGLFDALHDAPSRALLRERVGIGARASRTVLRVLVGAGLVEMHGAEVHATAVARHYLTSGSPFFKGAWFRTIPAEPMELLRTVHLQDGFVRPETARWKRGRVLDPAQQAAHMHAHTFAAATSFAEASLWASMDRVLDVAGGAGSFSVALARRYPRLRCTILDLPDMAGEAEALARQFGVEDRIDFVGLDMFKSEWPSGVDAVLLSNILHDWDPGHCRTLLLKANRAIRAGGRVVVNEMLVTDDGAETLGPALFSMMMLMVTEGDQLTMAELDGLLTGAGFADTTVVMERGHYSLISAKKPA